MSGYYLLKNGEFAYNKSYSVGYDFGSIKRLDRYPMGALSTLYICFALTQHNSDFMKVYFDSLKWYKEIYMIAAEGARNHGLLNVPTDDFFDTIHILPQNPNEQDKIAKFLILIEKRIEKQRQLVEALKSYKRGALSKLFPKKGENTPEYRFRGFTEPWEQRKFSELYEKVSRKNDMSYGKEDIISVANMYYKADSNITDDSYLLTYNVFELGDIAFEGNKSKNFAHGRFVENTIGNGIVSHVFDVFKPIMPSYDLMFWKYAINDERLMGDILVRSTKASTMMTNLVANDFLQESFLVPSYEEQKKIGTFFRNLDLLITLHQRKLTEFDSVKAGLLQQLFI